MNRPADASAKAKEVQTNTQADTIAPHLLLRQHTSEISHKKRTKHFLLLLKRNKLIF